MPRIVLLDFTGDVDTQAAGAALIAAGVEPAEALTAVDTLIAGVPAVVDVERTDGVVECLAEAGIEARIDADEEAASAA